MRSWHDFLDSLDSDGGKVMILMMLMLFGAIGHGYSIPKSEDILIGAFGALLMTLKDAGSNKDRREGPAMPLPNNPGASSVVQVVTPSPDNAIPVAVAVEHVADAIEAVVDKK